MTVLLLAASVLGCLWVAMRYIKASSFILQLEDTEIPFRLREVQTSLLVCSCECAALR